VDWKTLLAEPGARNALASLIVLAAGLVLRSAAMRAIAEHDKFPPDTRRRLMVQARNGTLVLIVFGLVIIWAQELRTVAVSLVAIAAAIVLATKEVILCLSGSFVRTSSHSFDIGDRIEIGGHRGTVVDVGAFTTTLLEIGPGQSFHQQTGRAVVLPNSIFLSQPLVNESFLEEYVLHTFSVMLALDGDWRRATRLLLEAARHECEPHIEPTRAYMHQLERKHGLDTPTVEPRLSIGIPEAGKLRAVVRIPCPAAKRGRIEQQILLRFLGELLPEKEEKAEGEGAGAGE
jgi:small-conductance mechanosensitive channel